MSLSKFVNALSKKLKINEDKYDDINRITSKVFIGNYHAARDKGLFEKYNIKAVLNCTKDLPFSPAVPSQYRIPVDDNLHPAEIKRMEMWAPEIAYKILKEYKKGHPILIHCYAGKQRSTAACAFFLLVLTGRPLIQVMYLIKSKRPVAFTPSANFASSMYGFEDIVKSIKSVQLNIPMMPDLKTPLLNRA